MELPVRAAQNADAELAASANPNLRLVIVPHGSSPTEQRAFAGPVAWAAATPASVAGFSGACYFMARDLQKRLGVPIGLIQASWGGSNIEAWIAADALARLDGHADAVALNRLYARDPVAARTQMAARWQDWWHGAAEAASSPWIDDGGLAWQPVPMPWRDWKTWGVTALSNYNGIVWFDRSVELTPAQGAQPATLDLGAIDEIDMSWVNGKAVGNSFGWATPRSYTLPPGTLRAGSNRMALSIYSAWGLGGMFGPDNAIALKLADGTRIPLGEGWRYAMPTNVIGAPPAAPWYAIGGETGLFNAMIAPIGSYAIKAAAWYQGESNTGNASEYAALLDTMKASWRARFGADLPVLVVQLPNFGPAVTKPTRSGWASVREAQRQSTARDPHAALAVTIDLGDPAELHPTNKQGVGLRLARAARALVYGERLPSSGPRIAAVTRDRARIVVRFADVTGTLATRSAASAIAFELCGPSDTSCRFVDARVDGSSVVLSGDAAVATRVRYCWGDAPVCNVYDAADLPAGPFEAPIDG
ncbi:9-O-acetylesterase [Sphingomonas sp. HMWF008]|nr:9-O-acetylesterase [Sphingomonas sp. HMWF008]